MVTWNRPGEAMRRATRRFVAGVIVAAVLAAAGCGGGSDGAGTTAGEPATASAVAQTEPAYNLAGLESYPREIPMGRVPENMRAMVAAAGGRADVAVLLAPGIYASRGNGPLGDIPDYTGIYGLCVDVNQFTARTGLVVGSTCW